MTSSHPASLFSPTLLSLYIAISTEVLIAGDCVLSYVHNARLFAGVSCVCIRVQFPLGSTTLVTPATALVAAQTLAIPKQLFTTNPTL